MNKENLISASIVALLVSIVIGIFVVHEARINAAPGATQIVQTPADQELLDVGGLSFPFHNTPEVFAGGVGIGMVNSPHDNLLFSASGQIGAGSNHGAWRNKTGRTVQVDYADISFPSGTASSSIRLYIGTSTAAIPSVNDFTKPFSTLIDDKSLATSTILATLVINSNKDAGTNGRQTIDVQDGEYVVISVLHSELTETSCDTTHACESATSTNRGWTNLNWYLRGHYKP